MNIRKIALIVIGVLLVGCSYIGITYSLWLKTFSSTGNNVVKSGCFEVLFEEKTKSVSLKNTYPISDNTAFAKIKPYQIKITNTCETTNMNYSMTLNTVSISNKLDDEWVKIAIGKNGVKPMEGKVLKTFEKNVELENIEVSGGSLQTSYLIETGYIETGKSKTFEVYLWINELATNEIMNQSFIGSISVLSYASSNLYLADKIKENIVTRGNGVYEVSHRDAVIEAPLSEIEKNNLKQIEYRYAGANPNNYVRFNNELWRIIGVVNTPEGSRVKLVRNESIGNYSWDSSDASVNGGYGVNEWSQADIKTLLNEGAYYNRTAGTCYNGANNQTTACNFNTTGLLPETKSMIDTVTWNTTGTGNKPYSSSTTGLANNFYNLEHSSNSGKICSTSSSCNDTVIRNVLWQGKVGLMYPTDYGFSTIGGSLTDRNACLSKELVNWNDESVSECKLNSWLSANFTQWSLFACSSTLYSYGMFFTDPLGNIKCGHVRAAGGIRPSLYLKQGITIKSGSGTNSDPFVISL